MVDGQVVFLVYGGQPERQGATDEGAKGDDRSGSNNERVEAAKGFR